MTQLPEESRLAFRGSGVFANCQRGKATVIDTQFDGDALLNGGTILIKDGVFGDSVYIRVGVRDPQGNFILLSEWVSGWLIPPPNADGVSAPISVGVEMFGEIYAGMVLRAVYNSIGTLKDPQVAVNLNRYDRL